MNYGKLADKAKRSAKEAGVSNRGEDFVRFKNFDPAKDECFRLMIKNLCLFFTQKGRVEFFQGFEELLEERRRLMEDYFEGAILEILQPSETADGGEEFHKRKILGLYKKNFFKSSLVGDLPLHLRLKVYWYLLQVEKDLRRQYYLRARMAATLAKLNQLKLAQRLSVFNWALAQEIKDSQVGTRASLNKILKSHRQDAGKFGKWPVDDRASVLAQEFCLYYRKVLIGADCGYTAECVSTLDLVAESYPDYQALSELSYPIKVYLRTKNKEDFLLRLEVLQKAFIFQHHDTILDEASEKRALIRDQAIIYREVIEAAKLLPESKIVEEITPIEELNR